MNELTFILVLALCGFSSVFSLQKVGEGKVIIKPGELANEIKPRQKLFTSSIL